MTRGMTMIAKVLPLVAGLAASVLLLSGDVRADRISDIRNTKHNLSANSTNTVRASTETEICVFCHTPHQTTSTIGPLWNRTPAAGGGAAVYNLYSSNSLDAAADGVALLGEPDGSSKLCLSCHDGTVALGKVNVLRGVGNQTIAMRDGVTYIGDSVQAQGKGVDTGYTRVIGQDLSNDHPISFTYDSTRADNDGELRAPDVQKIYKNSVNAMVSIVGNRGRGAENKPFFPLEDGKMQCATCHDPHIRDPDAAVTEGPIKFLREARMQLQFPPPVWKGYTPGKDILCLGCHTKEGWDTSAHALAEHTYIATEADIREFPASTSVKKAACLNCHDTHTVKGARKLTRDGTDGTVVGKTYKSGGKAAFEQTCYACHSAASAVSGSPAVPNVQTDFTRTYRMPIESTNEVNGLATRHDAGTKDGNTAAMISNYATLNATGVTGAHLGANGIEGRTQLNERHAECQDCHNPHRTMKNSVYDGSGTTTAGHHTHDETATSTQKRTNIASGALSGAWGVEPVFTNTATIPFLKLADKFTVKYGAAQPNNNTVGASYVTREYQICLKCHSSYAYDTTPPTLGPSININGLTKYSDQAMEFAAPTNDQGEPSVATTAPNHRSWHPVITPTSRTAAARGSMNADNWKKPWSNDVGNQTMYCTDCHGPNTDAANTTSKAGTAVTGIAGAWGPHGSANPFILKGTWNNLTGNGQTNGICFKCHDYRAYAQTGNDQGTGYKSGFCCGNKGANLHLYHAHKLINRGWTWRCSSCHVAVPHGWKNKALLVDLNNVGLEGGGTGTTEINHNALPYTYSPYYMSALLKVISFAQSGSWSQTNCGSKSNQGDEPGKKWMEATCSKAP